METLDEHNLRYPGRKMANAGVLCPVCKRNDNVDFEMEYVNANVILASDPPKMKVHCQRCFYSGYKLV
jgi:hypothetical protein